MTITRRPHTDAFRRPPFCCRGVFRESETSNTEAVLRLADYVRREVLSLLVVRRAGGGSGECGRRRWRRGRTEQETNKCTRPLSSVPHPRHQQPKEDVYRGWITWGPVVGETDADRLARQRRMLEGEWREALHADGRVFFYHTATAERRWDPPPGGALYGRRRFALQRYLEENEGARAGATAAMGAAGAAAALGERAGGGQ